MARQALRHMRNKLKKTHAIIFAVLWIVFTIATFLITNAGVDKGADHNTRVFLATISTITGPLTGAIARDFQGCCLRFSLSLMAYCAPFLFIGVIMQLIKLPDRKWIRVIALLLWTLGWLVWFMGGIVSYAHALS